VIELYLIEYEISGCKYSAHLPAESWEHAKKMATAIGAKVLGNHIHSVSAIPVEQLMDFCGSICDDAPIWKYNAREQLEAFLSIGWPVKPEESE
jgi:hypothetical protein